MMDAQALRLKRMASGQAVYMGKWEVTDEAVDVAMSELRKQDCEILCNVRWSDKFLICTR